jgi:excisionase family DNA binding protein
VLLVAEVAVLSREELLALVEAAAALAARRVLAERAASDELLGVAEVARRLGVSVRAVRAWVAAGELSIVRLPATTTGPRKRRLVRVRASDLAAFVATCEERDAIVDLAVARHARRAGGAR